MLARYEGEKLESAFRGQELVANIGAIAGKLANVSIVEELKEGDALYSEGDMSNGMLYFILSGGLTLSDRSGLSYLVRANKMIGEFPMLLPDQPQYAVTATARETSVVAKIPVDQFRWIAKDHPELWENMAKMLARRFKESNEQRSTK
jgi:CRP/FNR family transcriptional regulator, cyclic AMP receptor protein